MSAELTFPRSAAFVVDPFVPRAALSVSWPSGARLDAACDGAELTPPQVAGLPCVAGLPADDGALYTLILSDPDAPSAAEPMYAEWVHWVCVNAPAAALAAGAGGGEHECAYFGSAPGKGSGAHRYVLVAYAQAGKARIAPPAAARIGAASGFAPRRCFNSRAFAEQHKLTPVAAVTWRAAWDEAVPDLVRKLTNAA